MGTELLEYDAAPGPHTTLAPHDVVRGDVETIVAAVQGLCIYDTVAEGFLGVTLSPEQADTIHERDTSMPTSAVSAPSARPDRSGSPATSVSTSPR